MTRTGDSGLDVGDIIRREYRPCGDLQTQLAAYLKRVLLSGGARQSSLSVPHLGTIQVSAQGANCAVDCVPELRPADGGGHRTPLWPLESADLATGAEGSGAESNGASAVPIVYGDEALGALSWEPPGRSKARREAAAALFSRLGRRLGLHLNRNRVSSFTARWLQQEMSLIGASEELNRLEEHLERCAKVDLPVLLEGEFGTEKVQAACAVHFGSRRRKGPFVEVRCPAQLPEISAGPEAWFERARGGTLFLNGIDDLHPELQAQLPEFLTSRIRQWVGTGGDEKTAGVRLIAATARDLREQVKRGLFSKLLLAELSFLRIRLAPLRERREDIEHLGHHILHRHGQDLCQNMEPRVAEVLAAYDWPQNLFEMERVLGRLVAMRDGREIRLRDVEEFAPRLLAGRKPDPAMRRPRRVDPPAAAPAAAAAEGEGADAVPLEELPRKVLDGDADDFAGLHASVRRALEYIGDNYQDEITLGDLASAAYVSPSHLCYLFKSKLGVTFKTMLGMVRIERAKQLLVRQPGTRITDICLEVGFGDLSHFEKTFKRVAKLSPREFRRREIEKGRTSQRSRLSA